MIRTDISNLFRQAASHFRQGELVAAEDKVRLVLAVDPVHAEGNHLAGLIAMQHGQYEAAVNAMACAIGSSPLVPGYYYNYGIALHAQGRTDAALAAYEEAIRLNTGFPEAHVNRGIILSSIGRLEEALASYASAIRIKPDHTVAWFNRGNTQVVLQHMEAAQADYEQAIRLQPDFVDAHYNLANLLKQTQRWEQALKAYERVVQLNPGHAGAHDARGEILVFGSHLDAALAAFDQAISSAPEFAQAHYHRGNCLKQLGRLPEAADAYRKALQHNPDHVDAGYFLAVVDAEKPPAKSPEDYIIKEFDNFAPSFDKQLVDVLGYKIPWQLFDAVSGLLESTAGKLDILDLGCGTGLVGVAFSTIANRLDGIDLSPQMLVKARGRGIYTDLIEMDVCNALEQAGNNYDLILAADVFVYIGDLDELFSLVTQRLREGGLFAFSIEVIEDSLDYRLGYAGRYGQSLDYIRKLANSNGLEEVICMLATVRTENDKPVDGCIMVLHQPQPGTNEHSGRFS